MTCLNSMINILIVWSIIRGIYILLIWKSLIFKQLLEPMSRGFGVSFQPVFVIHMYQSKAHSVSADPLEVIQQRPCKVSSHLRPFTAHQNIGRRRRLIDPQLNSIYVVQLRPQLTSWLRERRTDVSYGNRSSCHLVGLCWVATTRCWPRPLLTPKQHWYKYHAFYIMHWWMSTSRDYHFPWCRWLDRCICSWHIATAVWCLLGKYRSNWMQPASHTHHSLTSFRSSWSYISWIDMTR